MINNSELKSIKIKLEQLLTNDITDSALLAAIDQLLETIEYIIQKEEVVDIKQPKKIFPHYTERINKGLCPGD